MDHSFNSSSKDHSIQSNDAKSIHNNSLQLQGKPLLDKSSSHNHKHDKTKCTICLSKLQNKNKEKKINNNNNSEFKQNKIKSSSRIIVDEPIKEEKKIIRPAEEILSKPMPEQPNLQIKITKHPNLTFLFDPVRDEYPNRPYHIDGDPKMYTEDMISIRMNLKNEAKVKKAINNFMILYRFDSSFHLSKKNYIDVNYKIICLLRPDLGHIDNFDEIKLTLEEDWKHDSKGKEKMTESDLFDSLYELVDIWTTGVDKDEYASFFEVLKTKIILFEQKNPMESPYDMLFY